MRCLFFLVITIVLSESQTPKNEPKPPKSIPKTLTKDINGPVKTGNDRLWWISGNIGKQGGNKCPPGSKFSHTPTTFDKTVATKSSYLEKCVTTSYDLKERSVAGAATIATKECALGSRWSKKRQICVKKGMGMAIPVGNNRQLIMRCAPGRRYSKKTKRCVLPSTGTKKGTAKKIKTKGLTSNIGSRPRPPPPRGPKYPPGTVGK